VELQHARKGDPYSPFSDMLFRRLLIAGALAVALAGMATSSSVAVDAVNAIGTQGEIGCDSNAKRLQRLSISSAGTYENLLIDGEWTGGTLVKVTADNVTLRRCEIRNGRHNAVTVYGKNVIIEACKIHHVLAGTFTEQHDAHGVTGRPTNLTIRNCDIGLTSGDSIQFDPGRGPWDEVLIENCNLWTAPLTADAAGFKRGERPGENAVDTKQATVNPRSHMTIRNCRLSGWNQPGQIGNMAALNLKNHVQVRVENCLFQDNEICFRVRGGNGEYGGAFVMIENCAVYDSTVAVRAENSIRDLSIRRLGIGTNVHQKLVSAGGGAGPGYQNVGEFQPPPIEEAITHGLTPRDE
jgi:hypothetical protein